MVTLTGITDSGGTANSGTDSATLTYSLTGGADMAFFSLDANSGALSFKTAPDFEAPSDQDQDNQYEVFVEVNDGTESASQAMTIDVTDVNETQPPTPSPSPIQVTPPELQPNTPSGQPSVSETISNNGAIFGSIRLVAKAGNNVVIGVELR
ncbi:cadherin repeat domain-containing protein [Vreelandella lionensis]|uniref:Cadherin repeat domain-containing protein n=1 Tax=Vreelandella lionensis TaxID=1144478 RepID=A0ABW8BSR5_9GAMM